MRKRFSGLTSQRPTKLSSVRMAGGMSDGSRSCAKVGMTTPRSRQRWAVLRMTSGRSCLMSLDISGLGQPPERGGEVFNACHQNHCRDDEWLEARLAIGCEPVALEHARGHLALRAAHAGNVGGQTVQVERVAAARELHLRLVALPALELGVQRGEDE